MARKFQSVGQLAQAGRHTGKRQKSAFAINGAIAAPEEECRTNCRGAIFEAANSCGVIRREVILAVLSMLTLRLCEVIARFRSNRSKQPYKPAVSAYKFILMAKKLPKLNDILIREFFLCIMPVFLDSNVRGLSVVGTSH
jgi:hypothetical protein